jgi:HEPN domain-containing protein
MSDPNEVRAWVAKAGNDLLNIDNNLRSTDVPWDTVCFHAQQVAEKLLKAILAAHGEIVPRTHDLSALTGQCAALGVDVALLQEDCQSLQPYAVLTRYPCWPFEPDEEEGRLAADAAHRLYDVIELILFNMEGS